MTIAAAQSVQVRQVTAFDELSQCEPLYRRVFGLRSEEGSLNVHLLVSLSRNSGIVLGAFAGAQLVGFTFSFLAQDPVDGTVYQYSQTAAVMPEWQGRGVGRQLKFAQREAALARGIVRIRWTFDPFKLRNAHFNLDVLGARATELVRRLYGEHGYGFDAESSTDRLIADWRLDSEEVNRLAAARQPRRPAFPFRTSPPMGALWSQEQGLAFVPVPVVWPTGDEHKDASSLKEQVLATMEMLLSEGLVIMSCHRLDEKMAVYRFQTPDCRSRERMTP